MASEIKLNSAEWCDMIFEGKNKSYGAYALRKSSSKRHIWAFVTGTLLVLIIVAIPSFLKAVQPQKDIMAYDIGPVVMADLDPLPEEEKIILPPTTTPPPPPIIDSRMFTPPSITPDELVDEDREMAANEELLKDKRMISIKTIDEGNTTGMDIRDIIDEQRKITNEPTGPEKVHEAVEVMPQFPGGDAELMKYLSSHIKYPTIMAEMGIQGRVILRFVVGKDGSISDVQIARALYPQGDQEAVRVVKSMPKWIPGQQNGHRVAVYFTLPVLFQLQ